MEGLLVRTASLYEAASEAAVKGDAEAAALLKASSSVIGAAIRYMGPEFVLKVLPLNLQASNLLPSGALNYGIQVFLCAHACQSAAHYKEMNYFAYIQFLRDSL